MVYNFSIAFIYIKKLLKTSNIFISLIELEIKRREERKKHRLKSLYGKKRTLLLYRVKSQN